MARKGENIYKRKDGRWEARCLIGHGKDGKPKYKYVYAHSYGDVKRRLKEINDNSPYARCSCQKGKTQSLSVLAAEWLCSKKLTVKESTFIRYSNIIDKHIIPQLGSYRVDWLSTTVLTEYVEEKLIRGKLDGSGGLSVKTISDTISILKSISAFAQYRLGTSFPCAFEQIKLKTQFKSIRVLSSSEEQRLVTVLTTNMDRHKLGVFICLFTGIRIGELCALQWKHISLSGGSLLIKQTMQRLQKNDKTTPSKTMIVISAPKSPCAIREIPLPGFLVSALEPFGASPDSYVLSGSPTKYVEPRTMQNKFKKYLDEGKIPCANFHCLRHTFATRCIEQGFELKALSEILGHSSVKITLDRYVHSSMEQKMRNMEKLSLLLPHSPSE